MKKIVLTGGGTAGHVTPNIALLPKLAEEGYEVSYIGAHEGIEKKLIADFDIPYYGIATGKLRRYFSLKNFTDAFRAVKGVSDAKKILKDIKPDIVFSKGGFVSVPVVLAASKLGIPIVSHESDITPGLANKISIPKSTVVCCNFPETTQMLDGGKAVLTGLPIRKELLEGDSEKGFEICGFEDRRQTILVMGGSLGSVILNDAIRKILPELLEKYNVVHLCGRGKLDSSLEGLNGYKQFEYVKGDMNNLLKLSDIVISRAGANAIYEFLAINKPNILIPLSKKASRGDQILNAKSFVKQGFSMMIEEEELESEKLLEAIKHLTEHKSEYIEVMKKSQIENPIDKIVNILNEIVKDNNEKK